MVKFLGDGVGRVVVINLRRDELLLENITQELKDVGIKNAIITSAIGSLQRAVFHRVIGMGKEPEDEFITVEKPLELASLQGAVIDGEPHFHMVTSDVEETYTGHLEPGTKVLYLVEITLVEIVGVNIQRIKDENNIAVLTQIRT